MKQFFTEGTGVMLDEFEVKMVTMLAEGLRAAAIGPKLKRSPRTIESRLLNLMARTDTKTHAELVASCFRQKLIK